MRIIGQGLFPKYLLQKPQWHLLLGMGNGLAIERFLAEATITFTPTVETPRAANALMSLRGSFSLDYPLRTTTLTKRPGI